MTPKELVDIMQDTVAKDWFTHARQIEKYSNKLLDALFIPSKDDEGVITWFQDSARCELFGIDENEPINWGDLSASVSENADGITVCIEEAAPNECPTLCEYVRSGLESMGWTVEVETEW